jgi:glutamate racemase
MAIVGLFDSGLGGLTVARQVRKKIPEAKIEYYGDNGRNPYGSLSQKTIVEYSKQILDFLAGKGVDLAIIACNTATAAALDMVKDKYNFPVLGIIEPGSRAALRDTKNKKIGVLGTEFTIKSGAYDKALKRLNKEIIVYSQACPKFTLLVEHGKFEGQETVEAVSGYLSKLEDTGIDTLILGCTHYPVLMGIIKNYLRENVKVIDPAVEVVLEVKEKLAEISVDINEEPEFNFYTSGSLKTFKEFGENILGEPIREVKEVFFGNKKKFN